MAQHISPAIAATFRSPVPEAYSWLEGREFSPDKPLMNVSQAAPTEPPPEALRRAMADALMDRPEAHLYGPVLGMAPLREEVAARWSREHGAEVSAAQVAITSGCNQAFASAIATLAAPGDEVIIPTPWYFNHKMWLDMSGLRSIPLPAEAGLLPDPARAKSLITSKTRAIALVSPNNPAGVEYPPALIHEFYELARDHGITLILDETYRDFMAGKATPHDLFQDPEWDETLIQLYSFSKAYRLTGHRVGAMTASVERLAQVEKFLDTVTICPSQIGQIGALWGMQNLSQWLAGERHEILNRGATIAAEFPRLSNLGWELLGLGGFFAYVRFPQDQRADAFAKKLLNDASILSLPGTMFAPASDANCASQLRFAFANMDQRGIQTLFDRLESLPN